MRIILDIVEIARFAFLVTSVTLALAGFGVNLLPFLFASGLFANVLYLAHTWYCKQIDDKLEKIFGWWNRDEVAPATVLESSARVG